MLNLPLAIVADLQKPGKSEPLSTMLVVSNMTSLLCNFQDTWAVSAEGLKEESNASIRLSKNSRALVCNFGFKQQAGSCRQCVPAYHYFDMGIIFLFR